MRPTAFIVTKPLQLLMALSIIGQLRVEKQTHLMVVDAFANARGVYDNLRSIDWAFSDLAVHFADTMADAYAFIRREHEIGTLFIDGDVGFRRHFSLARMKLRRPSLKIFVYEEGIGTYRTDLYAGMKAKVFPLLGIGTHFGGSSLTDGIYVCDPDVYLQAFPRFAKTLTKIDSGPTEQIIKLTPKINYIFNYDPIINISKPFCNIYLSSWKFDAEFIGYFSSYIGDNYIKFHPSIKSNPLDDGFFSINNTVPFEIFALDALGHYEAVNVFHHGTSACHYLRHYPVNFATVPG